MNLHDIAGHEIFIIINKIFNDSELLFYEKNTMYITKNINGELITKEAIKDPIYNGNRYDWKEKFTL